MAARERFTFFWRQPSFFSQWTKARFSVRGADYTSAEQYMMHQKAVLFGDQDIAVQIMATNDPRKQKALGRKVQNFDPQMWDEKCRQIVKDGNRAKFTQNPKMLAELVKTAGTVLVEASPQDKIWGIGLAADKPEAHNKATWRGKNWLGYALTELREELLQADAHKAEEET